jgi:hypothetical protein
MRDNRAESLIQCLADAQVQVFNKPLPSPIHAITNDSAQRKFTSFEYAAPWLKSGFSMLFP